MLDHVTRAANGHEALAHFNANPSIDVVLTGLVIGAGTKPLHDLIARLERLAAEGASVTIPFKRDALGKWQAGQHLLGDAGGGPPRRWPPAERGLGHAHPSTPTASGS